jgi:hypothetical protein
MYDPETLCQASENHPTLGKLLVDCKINMAVAEKLAVISQKEGDC